MTKIKSALATVRDTLIEGVALVAVSKTKPVELLHEAYEAGQRDFGENKVQEMALKAEAMPKDIRWHMIGHVQTNKIKYMASFVHLVHGVDREKVLKELDKQAKKANRTINCLLQNVMPTVIQLLTLKKPLSQSSLNPLCFCFGPIHINIYLPCVK